jgi:hypothetical protein
MCLSTIEAFRIAKEIKEKGVSFALLSNYEI